MRSIFYRIPAAGLLFATAVSLAAQPPVPLHDPANLASQRVSAPDLADTLPINHGALALEQLLRKLRTRASFMLIVAHPDDEDGGMLTYLSRGQGARVAMLTLTRGEGGQNLMSADFEDALGLIRTQELLAADRYMAVDQLFGTEVDFGFSKTKEEAFSKWTHERVLYDAVRAVRLYRPLVIASVFIGEPTDGHGQHQVSGEIAQEVFKAAGDPKIFPDQGLPPWQPLKVYARIPFARIDAKGMFDYATNQYVAPRFENYVTGQITGTVPKANVVVPEGTPDPLLGGLTYVQFARQGLALQKTQIGRGVRLAPAGRMDVSYHRYGSHVLSPDGKPLPNDGAETGLESGFFAGIDTSLSGIASLAPEATDKFRPILEKIDRQIADAQTKFDPKHSEAIAPQLRIALGGLDELIDELENPAVDDLPPAESYNLLHELRIKRVQLNDALVLALGLSADATSNMASLPAKEPATATMVVTQRSDAATQLDRTWSRSALGAGEGSAAATAKIAAGEPLERPCNLSAAETPESRPYFSRKNIEQPYYDIADATLRNSPATPPAFTCWAEVSYQGVPLTVGAEVHHGGQPVQFVPPVSIALDRHAAILRADQNEFGFTMSIAPANTAIASESSGAPPSWKPETSSLKKSPAGEEGFRYRVPEAGRALVTLRASVKLKDGKSYSEGYRAVGYGDLPRTNFYTPATLRVVPVDVKTAPGLNVAYLPGTGDDVPSALKDLGVAVHMITVADLTAEKLKPYDVVVLGVRAYEAHRDLLAANEVLNAYAAAGGIVVVQYNVRMPSGVGPYPLTLDRTENVVEEDAPVTIVAPTDPLLTWPNRITSADFSDWVEERGHGFMNSWDSHYTPLLETHDHGQPPQEGGLLVARTGKGAWIYVALALYRQLPEGVPGPYRLLANLISAGKESRTGVR
ncbi:MAG TPA: PIG-L family deacetylase [Acidobacteriaceae bacterium]|nr:PIG-L family deacetylase [Acidobacteriaceae bacterium]